MLRDTLFVPNLVLSQVEVVILRRNDEESACKEQGKADPSLRSG
jgi:hypothetical protein